jgi:hypothetical protein
MPAGTDLRTGDGRPCRGHTQGVSRAAQSLPQLKELTMTTTIESPNVAAQNAAVAALKARGFKFGLTVGDAFVRGIRDLGYKSSAYALAELVDNSIQAGAGRVDVVLGFEKTSSDKKPSEIAIIDDGHGMAPDMIRLAVLWGGTHREGDRTGMGRYGYGLPSSCVSIGKRFTVYSKVDGGEVHAVTVDLEAISNGDYNDSDGEIVIPAPKQVKLPKFAAAAIASAYPDGWTSGSAVVIDKLDRLQWTTVGGLRENLLRSFGVTYHKLRNAVSLYIGGTYCEPIDPLFLTPDFRFYDLEGDNDRAHSFEPLEIDVKDPKTRESVGKMIVRLAYMPPTFGSIDKRKEAVNKNANERFPVLKEYHGILFSRMGRLIGVEAKTPWTVFVNNDRYIKVEVEFPAALDEEFGITTSKQQVTVSERIWDILKQAGVPKAIEQLRGKVKDLKAKQKEEREAAKAGEARAAEEAMAAAKKHLRGPSVETQARQEARGRDQLAKSAQERAEQTGRSANEEQQEMMLVLKDRPFKLEFETISGGMFFRSDMLGTTKMLYINRAHRFYQDVYDGPTSSPEVRAALEVLLFAIADSILDAPEESSRMYRVELPNWSTKLDLALEELGHNVGLSSNGDAEEPAWSADDSEAAQAA